ncbi:unnamed protein product [Prunus armeniaca]|uniref:Uncharacterized protein n=1 Tax=Prunus armeniaca TaxID=36596 RepID=A0A6J5W3E1_PRUAR|nr:unnamed protein product [Prunus armeniaca]
MVICCSDEDKITIKAKEKTTVCELTSWRDEQGKVKWNSKEESCQLKVSRFSLVIDLGKF